MKRIDLIPDQKFKLHGRTFIAVPVKNECYGCAFKDSPEDCFNAPFCTTHKRADRMDVIFIRENK